MFNFSWCNFVPCVFITLYFYNWFKRYKIVSGLFPFHPKKHLHIHYCRCTWYAFVKHVDGDDDVVKYKGGDVNGGGGDDDETK